MIMIHQHSGDPGLCAHGPFTASVALNIWSVVVPVRHVGIMVWLLLSAVCKEQFDTPSEYLAPSFHDAQSGMSLAGGYFQLCAVVAGPCSELF